MTKLSPQDQFAKELATTRHFLEGKGFYTALKALDFARKLHTGLRKDGKTPEFAHQVFMLNYVRTLLPSLLKPEATLTAIILHDVPEDYDDKVSFEDIDALVGPEIGQPVRLLTKKYRGMVVPEDLYFAKLAKCPVGSIGKGVDRGHNIFTMNAAGWTIAKQENYLNKVSERFLPMLKEARGLFPEQRPAYENIKSLLTVQAAHIGINLEQAKAFQREREAWQQASAQAVSP